MTEPQDPTAPADSTAPHDEFVSPPVARPRRADAGPDDGPDAAPDAASPELPTEPPGPVDTGSDAWWRAQANAQREAAQSEPPVAPSDPRPGPPPTGYDDVVGPASVLSAPSPLDRDWVPADLPRPAATPTDPVTPEPTQALLIPDEVVPDAPVDREPTDQQPVPRTAAVSAVALTGPAPEPRTPLARPELEPSRIGPRRAIAGALIALSGVALTIVALLLVNKGDQNGPPLVALPTAPVTTTGSPAPTPAPSAAGGPVAVPVTAAPAPIVTPTVASSKPPGEAPVLPVTVLNNSRISGLADRAAARFRAGGWPVTRVGNYSGGRIAATTVYFTPGHQSSAARFATQFGIGRVLPRFPGLPGSGTTVVVTRDYR